jgi:hypothetical protein
MNAKQIGALAASLAALAVPALLPVTAAASPQMFDSGIAVTVNSKVIAPSVGNITFTGTDVNHKDVGTVTCTGGVMTGTVEKNAATEVEITIETSIYEGSEAEKRCASTVGAKEPLKVTAENMPWCLTSTVLEKFSIRGGSCAVGASNVRLSFVSALGFKCSYERASVDGGYAKEATPAKLVAISQTAKLLAGGSPGCPVEGHLSETYILETDVSPFPGIQIK